MLEIRNFTKTYPNGKVAVEDLNLRIEAGDIYGFIGHNGAGKTTTLRAIAGVLPFDKGDIFINGYSVKTEALAAKQQLAYIPDNPELYEHLTGVQYLKFIADIYRVTSQDRESLIAKYADTFELSGNLGNLISSYSHGMKQKLAIISALIHSPKLLIFDEPFVGLDPKASHVLKELMREMCRNKSSIFFSTHILDTAEKLCNKIAIIMSGKLISSGDIDELRGNSSLEDVFLELGNNE